MDDAKPTAPPSIDTILRNWHRPSHIRLHAGELTASEMRAILAVVAAIEREIEASSDAQNGGPWKDELPGLRTHMCVCPTCGNKRCPKAADALSACTGSNGPGQG